jgi:hypothetical protein
MAYLGYILPWIMLMLAAGTAVAVKMLDIRSKIFIVVASINGLLFLTCCALITISTLDARREAKRLEVKLEDMENWKYRHLDEITLALAQMRPLSQMESIMLTRLKEYGWVPMQPATRKLEMANEARDRILSSYFPTGKGMFKGLPTLVDNNLLDLSLRQIGFATLPYKPDEQQPEEINSLFYGSKLDIREVKLVALTLMRAGVEIRAIKPFPKETQGNLRAMKGEYSKALEVRRVMTVEDIEKAKAFR